MKALTVLLFIWLLQGCSAEISKEEVQISATVVSINAWYNLMPGSPGSFNMAGEVLIKNDSSDTTRINLNEITVYQNDKKIYRFTPATEMVPPLPDSSNSYASESRFLFSTRPGLPLREDVIDTMPVSANLHFIFGSAEINCRVDSIKIEKAY